MGKDTQNTGGATSPTTSAPPASSAAKAKTKAPPVRCKALINFQLAGRPPKTTGKDDPGTPTIDVCKGDVLHLPDRQAGGLVKNKWVKLFEEAQA